MLTLRVVAVHGYGSDVLGSIGKHLFEKVFTHLCSGHAGSRVGFVLKDERNLQRTTFASIDGCRLVRLVFGIQNHRLHFLCARIRFVIDIFVQKVKFLTLIVELNVQRERTQMTFSDLWIDTATTDASLIARIGSPSVDCCFSVKVAYLMQAMYPICPCVFDATDEREIFSIVVI